MTTSIITWIVQLVLIPALSPLFIGVIRKIKAKLQNRQGASIFQPYRDVWKLLHKDEVITSDASWIFRAAPYIIFAVTVIVGASIPTFASYVANSLTSDILVIIYLMAIGTFFLALAGMDTGGAFGGFGASREMSVAAVAEGGLIFSLLTVAIISGTTDVFGIAAAIGGKMQMALVLPVLLALFGFLITMLAETARFPFDNPATHLELTMIHEAMILEHSGKKLALLEWAAANKLLIFLSLASSLFFPWGIAQTADIGAIAIGFGAWFVKALVLSAGIAVLESSIAKYRLFRLPDLLLIAFILNCIAIGLIK